MRKPKYLESYKNETLDALAGYDSSTANRELQAIVEAEKEIKKEQKKSYKLSSYLC